MSGMLLMVIHTVEWSKHFFNEHIHLQRVLIKCFNVSEHAKEEVVRTGYKERSFTERFTNAVGQKDVVNV